MEQERRERERRERARKEAERVRKERERQRELEKAREREREKERERFIRERKEREEKERREKEREREMFERERLERERIERERKERERLEAERMERERQERQRLERERLEREARVEKERLRLEREARIERERAEREQQRRSMNQGIKRSNTDYNRYPESKRSYRDDQEQSRKPFFGGAANPTDIRGNLKDDLYDMAYRRNVIDSKKERDYGEPRDFEGRRRSDPRGFPAPSLKESTDIRRVVESANNRYPPSRERSPHRPQHQQQYENRNESTRYNNNTRGPEYEKRDKTWLDAPNPNAPKTLSDVLGRAGLTGILGSKAEGNTRDRETGFSREPEQRGYGGAPLRIERPERNDYSRNPPARDDPFKIDNRQVEERRVVHPERRDSREGYRESARRESRPEERRFDDRRREGSEHHKDPYMNDRGKDNFARREPASSFGGNDHREKDTYSGGDRKDSYINNNNRKPERGTNSRHELHERRDNRPDERRESRSDERRDMYRAEHTKPIDRGINRQPPPASSTNQPRLDNRSVTERRGLHPLAAEIAARSLPTIMQQAPRVINPSTSVYGRVMQQQPALRPGFPPAGSQPVTLQVQPPTIQLRDGRLEFTRVAPPGANIQPFPRRF